MMLKTLAVVPFRFFADSEELALGAEAKHYGHFSPRLSPLVSFEKDEKEIDDLLIR